MQNDLEWYDPGQRRSIHCHYFDAVFMYPFFFKAKTQGGSLRLPLAKVANPLSNHNLNYRSGMVCCFAT